MDSFIDLLGQILSLTNEQLDELEGSYEDLINSMAENQTLIEEVKQHFKLEGCTLNGLIAHKENVLAEMRALINNIPNTSERHKKLGHKILDVVAILYDKVAENYDFKIVKIPLEICHKNAVIPTYAHNDDAGFDFYLPEDLEIEAHQTVIAKVGLKMAIPVGYELQIRPRSGLSFKTGLRVANAPGTVDSGYRDEIGVICWNTSDEKITLKAGERIAQGVLNEIPRGQFHIVEDITKVVGSNRNGGFGSSGK